MDSEIRYLEIPQPRSKPEEFFGKPACSGCIIKDPKRRATEPARQRRIKSTLVIV
jgi:hypothetical protein